MFRGKRTHDRVVNQIIRSFAMAGEAAPGVTPEAVAAARMTLGAAVEVSHRLGDPTGAALLEASRTAFDRGMQLASWACAAAMIGTAVLAARTLPVRRAKTESLR